MKNHLKARPKTSTNEDGAILLVMTTMLMPLLLVVGVFSVAMTGRTDELATELFQEGRVAGGAPAPIAVVPRRRFGLAAAAAVVVQREGVEARVRRHGRVLRVVVDGVRQRARDGLASHRHDGCGGVAVRVQFAGGARRATTPVARVQRRALFLRRAQFSQIVA